MVKSAGHNQLFLIPQVRSIVVHYFTNISNNYFLFYLNDHNQKHYCLVFFCTKTVLVLLPRREKTVSLRTAD